MSSHYVHTLCTVNGHSHFVQSQSPVMRHISMTAATMKRVPRPRNELSIIPATTTSRPHDNAKSV